MHIANRFALNTGFLYARMAITVFMSLYATRLVLQALGDIDFGIFNLVGGVIAMLTFLNTSMATATQRFMSFATGAGDSQKLKNIFNVSIVLHLLIAGLVFLLFEGAGYFLFNGVLQIDAARLEAAKLIFQFTVVSTMFTIISVPYDAVINANENMLFYAITGILEAVCKLLIALYITRTGQDQLVVYGLLMASVSVMLLLIRRVYCHRTYAECELNIRRYFSRPVFVEMTGFAGWSLLGTSSNMLGQYGQGIVLNIFFGPVVNTAQGIANQVSGQLGALSNAVIRVLSPAITKSEGGSNREMVLMISIFGSKVSFFLLMLFFVPFLIELPYVYGLWLGSVPPYAVIFSKLLLIRILIDQLFVTLTSAITAVGKIRQFQIATSILNTLPVIVSFVCFYLGTSPVALYVVYLIYSITQSGLILHFASKHCGLSVKSFFADTVARCVCSLLIIYGASAVPLAYAAESVGRLLIVAIISTCLLLLTGWFIGLSGAERQRVQLYAVRYRHKLTAKNPFSYNKSGYGTPHDY